MVSLGGAIKKNAPILFFRDVFLCDEPIYLVLISGTVVSDQVVLNRVRTSYIPLSIYQSNELN